MQLEVEQKFWVDDLNEVREHLRTHGARIDAPIEQVDQYFAHPCRDYAQTDEALRIRRVGDRNYVTYKGPKLDATTKTRRELELPIADEEEGYQQFAELLAALGFTSVAEVRKQREVARLSRRDQPVLIALDRVTGLGDFVEIEAAATVATADAMRDIIAAYAHELKLSRSERRSYLELLLSR